MNIRSFQKSDINQLKKIHEMYYKHEFSLDDFCQKFLDFFVIEDNNQIICAGGVRTISESVIVTNKSVSPRTKRAALYQMLEAQLFTCKNNKMNQLHAFIQDDDWERHLIKVGFRKCKGNALFLGVE